MIVILFHTLKKVNCECDVKFSIRDLYDIKIDKNKLKSKFNIKNLINIKVVKCYKKLFCKKGILHNTGNYILLSIIFIYIICLIIFIKKDFKSLKKEIELLFNKNEINIDIDKSNNKLEGHKIFKKKN